jgi:hypothetical protein
MAITTHNKMAVQRTPSKLARIVGASKVIPRDKALNLARKSALRNQELLRRLA